jgi:CRP-like cAMP-binding protein
VPPTPILPPPDGLATLAAAPLFAGLGDDALAEVAGDVEWLLLPGGEPLFRRGDPGDAVYVVVSGRLRVLGDEGDASWPVLREIGRAENVGELSVLTGEPRSATVRAVRDTVLARLSRERFDGLVARHPQSMRQVTRILARWLTQPARARCRGRVATVAVVPLTADPPPRTKGPPRGVAGPP